MPLSPECKNRLYNFKFGQALYRVDNHEDDVTDQEEELVRALANTFADSGWFDGQMGVIVWAALRSVGVTHDG